MSKKLLVSANGDLYDMIAMLNDKARNQFYERMFKRNLKGGKVLDVGFGTGFTSLLAIMYGASSVDAYEQKVGRYEMGKELIQQIGYNDKIRIINARFYDHLLKENYECMVHEVLGENIWAEYMYYILRNTHIPVFPNVYKLEIKSFPIVKNFADSTNFSKRNSYPKQASFDMGVNFPDHVRTAKEKIISEYLDLYRRNELEQAMYDCEMMPPIEKMDFVSSYTFDHNKRELTTVVRGETKTVKYNEMPQYVQLDFTFSETGFYGLWLDFQFGDNHEIFSTTENYPGKSWDGYRDGGNPVVIYAEKGQAYKFSQDISNGSYLVSKDND